MSAYDLEPEPPRLAWSMWKRFLAAMFSIVFLTAASTATAVLLEIDALVEPFRDTALFSDAEQREILDDVDPGEPQTILLLGSDRRWGDRSAGIRPRSDTIILVRLDPDRGATAVMNIPRDLKVTYNGPRGRYEDKINAAYSIDGPRGTVRVVKRLMEQATGESFPIHHVVNINFGAFSRLVNRLGCFYVDVDRRYFNNNQPPVLSPTNYATIDLRPGYQRLCGQDALDFVRFRHLDTDIVRGARQQHFLSFARDQVDLDELVDDRRELVNIVARYTDTDIRSTSAVLRLLRLAVDSAENPIQRVRFRADLGEEFVTITDRNLQRTAREFLEARASSGAAGTTQRRRGVRRGRGGRSSSRSSALAPGLVPAGDAAEDQAVILAPRMPFPVYYPRAILRRGRFWDGYQNSTPRGYDLIGPNRRRYRAYRMTVDVGDVGEFYGIQGTNWRDPPLLRDPDERRRVRGRELLLFRDGRRLRTVAWRTERAAYWVSNTLLRSLTNRQMIGIARSLQRVGSSG